MCGNGWRFTAEFLEYRRLRTTQGPSDIKSTAVVRLRLLYTQKTPVKSNHVEREKRA